MITTLVDSNWLVDYLKGRALALELLTPLITAGQLATSIIVYGEIIEGLLDVTTPEHTRLAFSQMRSGIPALGLNMQTAEVFAAQRASLRARGQLIPDHDLWIAATALHYDLKLLSRDRHFERIPNLRIYQTN